MTRRRSVAKKHAQTRSWDGRWKFPRFVLLPQPCILGRAGERKRRRFARYTWSEKWQSRPIRLGSASQPPHSAEQDSGTDTGTSYTTTSSRSQIPGGGLDHSTDLLENRAEPDFKELCKAWQPRVGERERERRKGKERKRGPSVSGYCQHDNQAPKGHLQRAESKPGPVISPFSQTSVLDFRLRWMRLCCCRTIECGVSPNP
ncbi:hypothetical protein LY76DRAFT_267004 [Colletotrichum caudatum]|nr:hypothetical protein LY76DRAFT_267004 [Colletotrichum caudatum]